MTPPLTWLVGEGQAAVLSRTLKGSPGNRSWENKKPGPALLSLARESEVEARSFIRGNSQGGEKKSKDAPLALFFPIKVKGRVVEESNPP